MGCSTSSPQPIPASGLIVTAGRASSVPKPNTSISNNDLGRKLTDTHSATKSTDLDEAHKVGRIVTDTHSATKSTDSLNETHKVRAADRFEVFGVCGHAGEWVVGSAVKPWLVPDSHGITLARVLNYEFMPPLAYENLREALQSAHCSELIDFYEEWTSVTSKNATFVAFVKRVRTLVTIYATVGSESEINISSALRDRLQAGLREAEAVITTLTGELEQGPSTAVYIPSMDASPRENVTDHAVPNTLSLALEQCGEEVLRLIADGPFLPFVVQACELGLSSKARSKKSMDPDFDSMAIIRERWLVHIELGGWAVVDCSHLSLGTAWRLLLDSEGEPVLKLDEQGLPYRVAKGYPILPFISLASIRTLQHEFEARPSDVFVVGHGHGSTVGQLLVASMMGATDFRAGDVSLPLFIEAALTRRGRPYLDEIESWSHRRCFKTNSVPMLFPAKAYSDGRLCKDAKIVVSIRHPLSDVNYYYRVYKNLLGYEGDFENFFDYFMDGKIPPGTSADFYLQWYEAQQRHPEQIKLVFCEKLFGSGLRAVVEDINEWGAFKLQSTQIDVLVSHFNRNDQRHINGKGTPTLMFEDIFWGQPANSLAVDADPAQTEDVVRRLYAAMRSSWPPEMQAWLGSPDTCWPDEERCLVELQTQAQVTAAIDKYNTSEAVGGVRG